MCTAHIFKEVTFADLLLNSSGSSPDAKWPPLIDGLVTVSCERRCATPCLDQWSMRFVYVNLGMMG